MPRSMLDTLKRWVPMAYDAFLEYRMNAATISATGLAVIRRMLAGEPVEQAAKRPLGARMARVDGGARSVLTLAPTRPCADDGGEATGRAGRCT